MRLFIAEKPSLGRALAEAIGGATVKQDKLSITLSNGDVICWAAGHILELPTPEVMNPEYKSWTVSNLPIIPPEWKVRPKAASKDLLGNIGRLLKEADTAVNAGDADREGQLLIDEILDYYKYKGEILRILVTDMNVSAIRQALSEMKPNSEYRHLSLSAAARQRADWLLGINMTRLFTVTTKRERGTVLSVGRVQTPTLALVVNRDREIENFVPKPYYVVRARSSVPEGEFTAVWKPDEDKNIGLDEDGRIISVAVIDNLERKISGKTGDVTKFIKKKSLTQPSLTYSLSALQIDASRKYGYPPDDTLKILQSIYEAKYVTYPRSDCGYLPESLYDNRQQVMKTICGFLPEFGQHKYDLSLKTSAWNTGKTAEHHGIVPTGTMPVGLSDKQRDVYELVARRYAAQFLLAQEFSVVEAEYTIEGEIFSAKTKQCTNQGWHVLYLGATEETEDVDKYKEETCGLIPDMRKGEEVLVKELIRENKKTTPPKRFTEASLLAAMNNIHKFVEDKKIKKTLKDTLGIGTAATQSKIIDTLINVRGYILKDKKSLISTRKGRNLIDSVDVSLRVPDTTALWEQELGEIQEGRSNINVFLDDVIKTVRNITAKRTKEYKEVRATSQHENAEGQEPCPVCKEGSMRQLTGKYGKFWVCGKCGISLNDYRNKPQKVGKCPLCGSLAVRIKGKNNFYWLCKNKDCKKTFRDNNGKLVS